MTIVTLPASPSPATASAVLPTGEMVEMVYDPEARTTQFVCGTADAWGYEGFHEVSYRRSVQQQCIPTRVLNGPLSAVWHYEAYDC